MASHHVLNFQAALQAFHNRDYERAIAYSKSNLRDCTTPSTLVIRNCILISAAQESAWDKDLWLYHSEHAYKCALEEAELAQDADTLEELADLRKDLDTMTDILDQIMEIVLGEGVDLSQLEFEEGEEEVESDSLEDEEVAAEAESEPERH